MNRKQAFVLLKRSIENFNFAQKAQNCQNEAQTKKFLIEPFFRMLNYKDEQLIPEFSADFGERVSKKVDYSINLNKKEMIFIECKPLNSKINDKEAGQLSEYYKNVKKSKIAILTNGKEYKFYADVALTNTMDSKPFFVFNMENFDDNSIYNLLDFDPRFMDMREIIAKAQESIFIDTFENTFFKEMKEPSPEFLKLIYKKMDFKVKNFEERIKDLMNSSLFKSITEKFISIETSSNSKTAGIVTTDEEIQAYHTIRTLLIQNKKIPNERISYKDLKGMFNIMVDGNQLKTICQLKFTDSTKKIVLNGKEHELANLDEIIKFKSDLNDRALKLLE